METKTNTEPKFNPTKTVIETLKLNFVTVTKIDGKISDVEIRHRMHCGLTESVRVDSAQEAEQIATEIFEALRLASGGLR